MRRAVLFIVGIQYLAALLIAAFNQFSYAPAFATYFGAALGFAIFIVGGRCVVTLGWLAWRRAENPGRQIGEVLARSTDVVFVYLAVAAQLCVLSWLKVAMPYSVGFWADELLARTDAAIFGTDPWKLLLWVPSLDRPYLSWISATILVMVILPLLSPSTKRDGAIVSYFGVVALASLGQYILPSAGPVFYERIGLGERFSDLPVRPWVKLASDYLWANHLSRGESVGTGISAFPSLHVAGAVWVSLVISSYCPRLTLIAWAYFAVIMIGSVQLGWHYAVDGLAGLIGAIIVFKSCKAYFQPAEIGRVRPPLVTADN